MDNRNIIEYSTGIFSLLKCPNLECITISIYKYNLITCNQFNIFLETGNI